MAVAIASTVSERPLRLGTALVGEVGLGGELRPVAQLDRRLAAAQSLGFQRVIVPKLGHAMKQAQAPAQQRAAQGAQLQVMQAGTLREAIHLALAEKQA